MSFEYSTPAITKWNLDAFLDVIDDFEDVFADSVNHKVVAGKNYQMILLHIAGKSLVTTREILTLCAHGYPDGALSLGRNLYEQMVIVSFFEKRKDASDFQNFVSDFFLGYSIQRNKCLRAIDKYIPDGKICELEDEWAELKKKTTRPIKGDYWWSGFQNFASLAESILDEEPDERLRSFLGKHYATYKRACVALHAGCMGNSIRIGSNTGCMVVDTSPTVYGQSTPLIYAVTSLIAIIGTLCTNFNIEHENFITTLTELLIDYQKREKEDIKQG